MVIFGSGAESRPAIKPREKPQKIYPEQKREKEWSTETRMVAVVYGSEGGELGFPSVAQ